MKILFEVFFRFLSLGLTSFGGPTAHLGYFRMAFVHKLKWLDDESYSKIIVLSQFLPGPSSSQVGFAIGLKRAGIFGGIMAFLGFTIPSFFALYLLSIYSTQNFENQTTQAILHGLKIFAVVIVADAVLSMFKNFCQTKLTIFIFILSTIFLLITNNFYGQIIAILASAIFGILFIKNENLPPNSSYKKINFIPLFIFLGLLFVTPFLTQESKVLEIFNQFYQAGSFVFGGCHVVLPLLQSNIQVSNEIFLTGYSLAQAVPGPMFSIASFLGANLFEKSPFIGSLIATIAIFLPGFLLILAFSESFESYAKNPKITSAIIAINASVVALLFSAFLNPIIPSAINSFFDIFSVFFGFILLKKTKIPIFGLIFIFCFIGFLGGFYV